MKFSFMKILGIGILASIGTNAVVNTASRIRRDRLEDENYQEEIRRKREERETRKAEKAARKAAAKTV